MKRFFGWALSLLLAIAPASAQLTMTGVGGGFGAAGGAATTTYNPSDKAAAITLSGGNLVATQNTGSAFANVRSISSQSSGKLFFEVTFTTQNFASFSGVGVANATESLTAQLGQTNNSVLGRCNGTVDFNASSLGPFTGCGTQGVTVGVAVDLTAKKIWFWESSTNQWNGDPSPFTSQNPSTNTGGYSIAALTCPCLPITEIWQLNDVQTANFGASAYVIGTRPTGFGNW